MTRFTIKQTIPALSVALALTLGACASAPLDNAALDDAKSAYARASTDAQVARSAPVELRKAQQALQQAESAHRAGEDTETVNHYATLARQRTEVAVQAGKIAQAEKDMADASEARDRILIDSRTQEADGQRVAAEKARMEADAARKLAEDRLAAVQASQAQTDSARARAKSLEEQMAALKAKQTDRGMVLTLGDVLFATGRAELNPGAARTLDQLASFMKKNPDRTIEIEGHTDSTGSDVTNQVLSERRAMAVKSALVGRGIAAERMTARGLGEDQPVAGNDTGSGRQQNRRVEIVFAGKP